MKYWLVLKNKLNHQIEFAIQLLLLFVGVYCMVLAEASGIWKIPIIVIGLFSWLVLRQKFRHPIIWIVFFILLCIDLLQSYFLVANHHFMLIFIVLSILLYKYHERSDVLVRNVQLLMVIVVITSVIQKLTSAQFMSGNFYYYNINTGSFFKYLTNLFPENLGIMRDNSEHILALKNIDPNLYPKFTMQDAVQNLALLSVVFAWTTIVLELLIAFAIFFKPNHKRTHVLLLVMIIGILFTRLETGFMALLSICGLFLCSTTKLKIIYVIVAIGCVVLIISKIGYH